MRKLWLVFGGFFLTTLSCLGAAQSVSPLATIAAPAPATSSTPGDKYVLREGDDVPLKFAQDLSSKTAAEGDPVKFVLANDLTVGGVVVAKAGSKAYGEVTNVKKSGMMGKAGELNIRLDHLRVGDTKVRLRGAKGKEGNSGTSGAIVLTVLFGPIGLIKHGHNIDIKEGTALTAYAAEEVPLPAATPSDH